MASFESLDATKWSEIEPQFQEFLDREINSAEALEAWLLELGRFSAYVGETGSMLYVKVHHQAFPKLLKLIKALFSFNSSPKSFSVFLPP